MFTSASYRKASHRSQESFTSLSRSCHGGRSLWACLVWRILAGNRQRVLDSAAVCNLQKLLILLFEESVGAQGLFFSVGGKSDKCLSCVGRESKKPAPIGGGAFAESGSISCYTATKHVHLATMNIAPIVVSSYCIVDELRSAAKQLLFNIADAIMWCRQVHSFPGGGAAVESAEVGF